MTEDRIRQYEPLFGCWKVTRQLGKGAFGTVYELCRQEVTDPAHTKQMPQVCALKVIHIPLSPQAVALQREVQPDGEAVKRFFARQVRMILDEIRLLHSLRDNDHIVRYEEHQIRQAPAEGVGFGWDILIRMELLHPLSDYFAAANASAYQVVCLWRDIADALICCAGHHIIHRDIKPNNIMVSTKGVFKLADFGAARQILEDQSASTRVGTERYMAPEVYRGERYDARADLYALGCVVYYFLNRRRHPFLPPYPQEVTALDLERAQRRRMLGERVPEIPGLPGEVNRLLRRCMAEKPRDRCRDAMTLYRAITKIQRRQEIPLRRYLLNPSRQGQVVGGKEKPQSALAAAVLLGTVGGLSLLTVFLLRAGNGAGNMDNLQPGGKEAAITEALEVREDSAKEAMTETGAAWEDDRKEAITEGPTAQGDPTEEGITEAEPIREAETLEADTEAGAAWEDDTKEAITEAQTAQEDPTEEGITEAAPIREAETLEADTEAGAALEDDTKEVITEASAAQTENQEMRAETGNITADALTGTEHFQVLEQPVIKARGPGGRDIEMTLHLMVSATPEEAPVSVNGYVVIDHDEEAGNEYAHTYTQQRMEQEGGALQISRLDEENNGSVTLRIRMNLDFLPAGTHRLQMVLNVGTGRLNELIALEPVAVKLGEH